MTALTILLAVLAVIAIGVLVLARKLAGPAAVAECDPAWVENFSVGKYRPMMRLLDSADYDFLQSQPGTSKKMVRQLRAERRDIFRSYLRALVRDFHRLHLTARMVLAYSELDRPELVQKLLKQRLTFTLAVLSIEVKLVLHAAGVGTVDVRALLGSLEAMSMHAGTFAQVRASA